VILGARRLTCLTLALAALAAGMPGCGDATEGAPTRLNVRTNLWVADIPVPDGFKLNEEKSRTEVSSKAREIDHLYEGGEALTAVRNFYIDQMPRFQWQSVTEELNDGVYNLQYTKGKESCQVQVRRGGHRSFFNPVQIRVRVGAAVAAERKKTGANQ